MSEVSISSDECGGNKTQEDPVICLASNRVNKQNRAPIRMSDYLRLEEHGIINYFNSINFFLNLLYLGIKVFKGNPFYTKLNFYLQENYNAMLY